MTDTRLLRPDDRAVLRAELRALRQSGVPVAFAGEVAANRLRLVEFVGTRTTGLHNLEVHAGTGLGGRVFVQGRPAGVTDYGAARTITHDYDRPVLAEGLSSILAVPVQASGRCRAVLYGALRQPLAFGDRMWDQFIAAGRRLAHEFAVRDEVDCRLAMAQSLAAVRHLEPAQAATLEELRSVHSELRAIAGSIADPGLQRRVYAAAQRLADLGDGEPTPEPAVRLSTRETDVLSQVALGCTNAEVADRLALSRETVKAYLQSAMRKLDARTRHEAVVRARKAMLLP
ncbi:LuxR C-terminal-related transcriptional regulator [Actinokineospora sp. UTMC 2448]|uniref:helix-turn-helix transcriptional regulator n=1 Tax=Actinokineospora sp. UTMC 2448 TaxID=2268449 RepID=UPI002164E8AA|nr:LuxR C-terminal-related transcriptional regulator [Actinokineospora sp. UTMC 2448]UVS76854.1 transcriptional regulator NarP [Actinokineospora sp. UTMC 2448]